MLMLDRLLALIAPHDCLRCGKEGRLACADCIQLSMPLLEAVRTGSGARIRVYAATSYQGLAKALIKKLKSDRTVSAGHEIAAIISDRLPALPIDTLVIHVPTATQRIRQRGYDQAGVIAKRLARIRSMPYAPLLVKLNQKRQVGLTRSERLNQSLSSYRLRRSDTVRDRHILLIDDVMTTGASIDACAQLLISYGAKSVQAAVFAHKL